MPVDAYDVIMMGGGVMGCATATYLLNYDDKLKVAIIEKDPTYTRASTPLSDGNIRVQFNIKENILMSLYGLKVLEHFEDEMALDGSKLDIAFRRQGNLFLFDEFGQEGAEQGLALQKSLGCKVDRLTPEEINKRYPLFSLAGCAGGTLGRQDGTMDPHTVLQGYKNKAISLGAHFIKAEVVELLKSGNRVTGVSLLAGETLNTGIVVNSAGAWAGSIAQSVGIDLPIQPIKRQVFVIETNVHPDGTLPLTVFPSGLYLVHERGGHFTCGKSFADDPISDDDFNLDEQMFEQLLWPELVESVPAFDRLKVVGGWAGLYAVNTLDGNAILGEWPELKGFLLANGFSGHGFQHCHAVGRYLAEMILAYPPTLDLSVFSAQRILENRPVFEDKHKLV